MQTHGRTGEHPLVLNQPAVMCFMVALKSSFNSNASRRIWPCYETWHGKTFLLDAHTILTVACCIFCRSISMQKKISILHQTLNSTPSNLSSSEKCSVSKNHCQRSPGILRIRNEKSVWFQHCMVLAIPVFGNSANPKRWSRDEICSLWLIVWHVFPTDD